MPKPIVASYCTTFLKPEMLHIYRQIIGLQRYETYIIAKERKCAERYPFPAIELMPRGGGNFLRHFYLKHLRGLSALHYRGEMKALTAILQRRPADLMHIYFGHTGVHLLPFIREWKKPVIVSFHGMDVQSRPNDPEYETQLRQLLQTIPLVLVRSQSLIARLCELGCPPEKIRLNRTGIPLAEFPFQPREIPANGEWRFVQACRFVPKKGIATTLRAFAKFHAQHSGARLILAGDGPMRGEIETLIASLSKLANDDDVANSANRDLANAVEIRGFLAQKELRELYHNAHLFLHPSEITADKNQEGVPNAMLEAMSTGLPILATRHGGIPEAVTDGKDGFLVAERDHEALADAMEKITASPELFHSMSEAAAKSVAEKFEQTAAVAALEAVYDEALANPTS